MAGLNHEKRAMSLEAEGRYKEAGDHYALIGENGKASRDYTKFLIETDDLSAVKDFEGRMRRGMFKPSISEKKYFNDLILEAKKRSSEAFVGAGARQSYISHTGYATWAARQGKLHEDAGHTKKAEQQYGNARKIAGSKQESDNIERIIDEETPNRRRLEGRHILAAISLLSLLGALLSFSFSATGNVIGNLSHNSVTLFGTVCFVFGTLFTFLLVRSKR